MTTFREFLADLIREYFAIPRSTPEVQAAASNWQPSRPPRHLERRPDYQSGMYTRRYHLQLERAIHAATTPNMSRINTTPLASRDIEYASTPPIEAIEDDDVTEMRPAIKLKRQMTSTQEIPAITAEILLLDMMRSPTHAQSTGENERIDTLSL